MTAFTAHNIALPDGSQTRPGPRLISDSGICRAALRDLEMALGPAGTVADLGCLEGGYSAALARAGYDVTGVEAREENMACCRQVENALALPNLRFILADARDLESFAPAGGWDAVFCCGLLYHLDEPAAFLRMLGRVTRRLLILQTHYSDREPAERHEGYAGHWYDEPPGRWSASRNSRSFWPRKPHLMAAIRDAGFPMVLEQADYLEDIVNRVHYGGDREDGDRSMFIGIKP